MKKLILALLLISNICVASTVNINGYNVHIEDRKFYFLCISNYKWIQFLEHGVGHNNYYPSGDPQQLFERYEGTSVPVRCD